MTKRSLTREEVLQDILQDGDQSEGELSEQEDFDDPMCPMAMGSDDEFMDLDEEQNTWFDSTDNQPQCTVSSLDISSHPLVSQASENREFLEYVKV